MIGTTPDFAELTVNLLAHPAVDAMAEAVRKAAFEAASSRQSRFPSSGAPESLIAASEGEWSTELGDVAVLLRQGASERDQLALLQALLALGVRGDFPSSPEQELETVAPLTWLAAHTSLNPYPALDAVLGDGLTSFWQAVARLLEAPRDVSRTELLVAAAALRDSTTPAAAQARSDLSQRLGDPLLLSVLGANKPNGSDEVNGGPLEPSGPTTELSGEIAPAPKGPVLTAVMAVTLLLALVHLVRLLGRYAFAFKRPAKVRLSDRGLEISYHTEMLGKTLRERATLVPLSNLARVTREVRFARAGMYAGLVALVLGSYLGMGLFMDGIRVPGGSITLLGLAVLFILLGLGADFALSSLSDSVRGKCSLLVVPRKGPTVCIGALTTKDADAILNSIAEQSRS